MRNGGTPHENRNSFLTVEEVVRDIKALPNINFTLFYEHNGCAKYCPENSRLQNGGNYSWLLLLTQEQYEGFEKHKTITGSEILKRYEKP